MSGRPLPRARLDAGLLSSTRLTTRVARLVAGGTIVLSLVLVQVPALAAHLHVAPLHADDWALAAAGSLVVVAPLALHRLVGRRCQAGTSSRSQVANRVPSSDQR